MWLALVLVQKDHTDAPSLPCRPPFGSLGPSFAQPSSPPAGSALADPRTRRGLLAMRPQCRRPSWTSRRGRLLRACRRPRFSSKCQQGFFLCLFSAVVFTFLGFLLVISLLNCPPSSPIMPKCHLAFLSSGQLWRAHSGHVCHRGFLRARDRAGGREVHVNVSTTHIK